LFDAVQAKLAERTNPRSPAASRRVVSLLAGMIRDHRDRPMAPSHTQNHGRRYRYYVSHMGDDAGAPALRLPAGELDAAVRQVLASILMNCERTRELPSNVNTERLARFVEHCAQLGREVASVSVPELRGTLQLLDISIRVDPVSVTGSFSGTALLQHAGIDHVEAERITFAIPVHHAMFGHEARLRLDPQSGVPNPTDQRLVEAIARSFAARERLLTMTDDEVAALPVTRLRHLQRIVRLSYLDPTIVRSVLDGSQPSHLSARNLWRQEKLPMLWSDQRVALDIVPT
jgi:hypothetical protein